MPKYSKSLSALNCVSMRFTKSSLLSYGLDLLSDYCQKGLILRPSVGLINNKK